MTVVVGSKKCEAILWKTCLYWNYYNDKTPARYAFKDSAKI